MDLPVRERGAFLFGPFRLDNVRRCLLREGVPVPLTPRLFETLLYLVEHHDRLVERDELERAIWQGRLVEEGNLGRAISSLRKALRADDMVETLIITVPGRGFRFTLPVTFEALETDLPEPPSFAAVTHPAPRPKLRARLRWAAAAACLACAALLWRGVVAEKFNPPRLSLAVLPLRTAPDDSHARILADNIADDLTGDLRPIPGSTVRARETALAYANRSASDAGRALNVRYLIAGSLQTDGPRVHVHTSLIDTVTGNTLWARDFDEAGAHPWETQATIVHGIASALNVTLVDAEIARAAHERPNDPDALDLFYQARSLRVRAATLDDLSQVQHLLERATSLEPQFTEALATLGHVLEDKITWFSDPTSQDDEKEANQAISAALDIDRNNSQALAARGRLHFMNSRTDEARASFEASLRADASNVAAISGLATCAWFDGAPDLMSSYLAREQFLDPEIEKRKPFELRAGLAALFGSHVEQAARYLLRYEAQDLSAPKDTDQSTPSENARLYLIAAYEMKGDHATAARRLHAFEAVWHHRSVWRELSYLPKWEKTVPGFTTIRRALVQAGMQNFSDEHEDNHIPSSTSPLTGSDFSPTPLSIPGGQAIDTAKLRDLLRREAGPILVQVGRLRKVLPGAVTLTDAEAAYGRQQMLQEPFGEKLAQAASRGLVVIGTGPAGVQSYNAALHFISLKLGPVYWYRGGEEAWAAQGASAGP